MVSDIPAGDGKIVKLFYSAEWKMDSRKRKLREKGKEQKAWGGGTKWEKEKDRVRERERLNGEKEKD